MNVITLASRKGGAGKSTLTAQLAAQAHASGKRVTIIDADPQGSLSLWHSLRKDGLPKLITPERGLDRALAFAMIEGTDYVFIDTAPTMWVVVQEAIRVATMVLIPPRLGFFDLAAVRRRRAEALGIEAAVDRVALRREEDRMRHRRVVPLLGEVVALHAEGFELAVRRVVLHASAGRNRPMVERPPVDLDGHLLDRLVDGDLDGGLRRRGSQAGGEREDDTDTRHDTRSRADNCTLATFYGRICSKSE